MNLAINGFGRIGRLVFRSLYEKGLLDQMPVVAINDLVPADNLAYLLKYDTVHGRFSGNIVVEGDAIVIDGKYRLKVLNIKEGPAAMPWRDMQVDVVVESTGVFRKREQASGHIQSGAKRVLITAPSEDSDITVVMGVNNNEIRENHNIISAASCTTNCVTPLVYVLEKEGIGVAEALMSTSHSYTASQSIVDSPNKSDYREGRAAAQNMIPASTGAAKAVVQAMPSLAGKITGMSIRVPTVNVSLVDLTVRTTNPTSYKDIVAAMERASTSYLSGILEVTHDPVVSSDMIHYPASAILDALAGIELNDHFFKLIAWYDNEWGYSNRVAELLAQIRV